jgi:hypothetical protein
MKDFSVAVGARGGSWRGAGRLPAVAAMVLNDAALPILAGSITAATRAPRILRAERRGDT